MSPRLKTILLIAALVAVAALIGWGLYYMFRQTGPQPTAPGTVDSGTTPDAGQLPGTGDRPTDGPGAVPTSPDTLPSADVAPTDVTPGYYQPPGERRVSSDSANYPSISQNGTYRYHNDLDGKFYQVGADGQVTELSNKTFFGADKVTWASNRDKAVIEYPDDSKIIYNFETDTQVSLPKHWEDFSFSPDGNEVAAKSLGLAVENRWLVTSQDDGSSTQTIEPLGNNEAEVQINWSPSRQVVAFSQTGQALGADRREILMVGLNGENFKSLVVEGSGFAPQWSPTGKKLLYSVYSDRSSYKPELWISDAFGDDIGKNRRLLNVNTWVDKCTFGDDSTVYCAVPDSLPEGAGLSRQAGNDTTDTLYRIDLSTGLKTPLPTDRTYNITNLSYDSVNKKLFFIDLNNTGVFELEL